ncbi:hypothetical protein Asp14428_47610 [Actinoplanes sp. NBRC 14428]|uniref:Excreted virulence factor EspC (Type VII ESX diderm) n=1 Tax=Pseudosporangium ferrugineum TaxID=439699 RepID=A0A2T0S1D6_9ACTN|nr:hypothetical protein [Pseudosporangium ferrugineum]PRY27229.1 hypothetical protein CLV70_111196 [Pseudosporangium ferrugineum]BCJ53286.1 hypothetical protein Asp14428_47610 [Actinoplanes sp. NBRC 14428]
MGELWLDPGRAAAGGRDLTDAGRHLTELRNGAGAEVAARSDTRPWGSDDAGQAFERNYRPIEQQVLQAWEKLGGYVEGLGDAVVQAVREATRTDDAASVRVEHTYRKRS